MAYIRISQCLCDRNLLMVVRFRRWLKAVLQRNFTCLFIDRMLSNQTPLFFVESAATINSVPASWIKLNCGRGRWRVSSRKSSGFQLFSLSILAILQLLISRMHVSTLDLGYSGSPGHYDWKDIYMCLALIGIKMIRHMMTFEDIIQWCSVYS